MSSEEHLEISSMIRGSDRYCAGEIHGNPSLLHRVVHVLVFNSHGHLPSAEAV
jgi:hypothetical protein